MLIHKKSAVFFQESCAMYPKIGGYIAQQIGGYIAQLSWKLTTRVTMDDEVFLCPIEVEFQKEPCVLSKEPCKVSKIWCV